MKKIIISILVLSVVGAAVFFVLELKQNRRSSIVQVLPETSLVTIHLKEFSKEIDSWQSSEYFNQIPQAKELLAVKNKLDSLNKSGEVPSSLLNLEFWISIHSNGSDGLNTLFFSKAEGFEWNAESVNQLFGMLLDEDYVEETQLFNDEEIHVLKGKSGEFDYGIKDQFLFWSNEAVLIEDVIRAINDTEAQLFSKAPLSKRELEKLVYLNGNRLNELSRVFLQNGENTFKNSGLVYLLDFEDIAKGFSFNGIGLGSNATSADEASLFAKNFISSESTFSKWRPIKLNDANQLSNSILPQSLSIGLETGEKVRILELSDTISLARELNVTAEKNLSPTDSLVYSEEFMFTKIGYINEPSFLSAISADLSEGDFYYTIFQNVWIISESVDALKRVLIDFDEERTLGRDVKARSQVDDLVQETSFTLLKNFNYSADLLSQSLKPKWQTYFNTETQLQGLLNQLVLQVNNTGSQSLVSGSLDFNQARSVVSRVQSSDLPSPKVISNVFADSDLTTKPFVVRNHMNAQLEIIHQDANNQIYLSDLQGGLLWKRAIDGQIKGSIKQVDFYNNKKLQYLMVTDSLLHLIDRNGKDVEGFPVAYRASQEIEDLAVIDYDNSKRYRYLLKGAFGDLLLLNKQGELLEGWNPKSLSNQTQRTPFHTRVRGRDAFVAIDYLGNFDLLNRRAESYEGFPVSTQLRLSGDMFFNKGPNFEASSMTLLGKAGMLQTVNFLGQTVEKKQLFKPDSETSFELLADVTGSTYRILQKSGGESYILNSKGERLFIMPESSSGLEVTFYNFRHSNGVYAVRNLNQKKLELLNESGEVISESMDCDQPPSILFFQNSQQYQVFVNFANQLTQYAIDAH